MIGRFLILSSVLIIFFTASDPYYGIDSFYKPLPKKKFIDDVREHAWVSTDSFRSYLLDYDDRVSDLFPVSEYYYPNVYFWFLIYTQFSSHHTVIHDKVDLSIIYKVLDFSYLHKKNLSYQSLWVLQDKISEEKVKELKDDFNFLSKNPFSIEPRAKIIYRTLLQSGVIIPSSRHERISFFKKLKDNLRTQVGQKNFIEDGLKSSLPYQGFLTKYFHSKHLPTELLAIPFLESSFNPRAESRVGASGVWQFMPLIASFFMPKRSPTLDYRSNIAVASVSAAFLLEENFKILKSWDLAVTAYNSGTKHLLKSKRELGHSNIDLETIIRKSRSNHFGFASKNFYSEFLALAHTIAYREEIFEKLHTNDRYNVDQSLKLFISKCNMELNKVIPEKELEDVLYHNNQIKDVSLKQPRGLILSSKLILPESKFFQLSFNQIKDRRPLDWIKYLGNQSCSTR